MWGDEEREADRWFPINPENRSGAMIYKLSGLKFPEVWVTNCCRQMVTHATKHGKPDPEWVIENLDIAKNQGLNHLPLLVMGSVAQRTINRIENVILEDSLWSLDLVYFLSHPAARNWSKVCIEKTQRVLNDTINSML